MVEFSGSVFVRYQLEGEISRGGMGVIHRAFHSDTGRVVALKLQLNTTDFEPLVRFKREIQALTQLTHPNVVKILDYGEVNEVPFYAMELIDGQDFGAWIEQSRVQSGQIPDWRDVIHIVLGVARALDHCHERDLLHRDVKPKNIVIESGSRHPILVDFGLVRVPRGDVSVTLTQQGQMLGTLPYMSPEQFESVGADSINAATDIWGLGATLFYGLTGQRPFPGDDPMTIMRNILDGPPKALLKKEASQVPAPIRRLCLQCLIRDQSQRPSLSEFIDVLESSLAEPVPQDNKVFIALSFIAVLTVLTLLIFVFIEAEPKGSVSEPTAKKVNSKSKTEYGPIAIKLKSEGSQYYFSDQRLKGFVEAKGGIREFRVAKKRIELGGDGSFNVSLKGLSGQVDLYAVSLGGREVEQRVRVLDWSELIRGLHDIDNWKKLSSRQQEILARRIEAETKGRFQFLELQNYSVNVIEHRIATFAHKKTGLKFQLLPGGSFEMGVKKADEARIFKVLKAMTETSGGTVKRGLWIDKVYPNHKARTRPFFMGTHEVSFEIYKNHAQGKGSLLDLLNERAARNTRLPAHSISWKQATEWLQLIGEGLRLPSEVEWEYACRAGSKTLFFWGEAEVSPALSNYKLTKRRRGGLEGVYKAEQRKNAFGLVHISGNVAEWVGDRGWYLYSELRRGEIRDSNYYATPAQPEWRILRGGSVSDGLHLHFSAARKAAYSKKRRREDTQLIGFRAACSLPELFLKPE